MLTAKGAGLQDRCVNSHGGGATGQVSRCLRDVGQVQGGGGGEDVGVVLGAGLLEAVQRGAAVVLGQTLVLVAFAWQLHAAVLGERDAHRLPVQTLPVQVAHG